MPAIIYVSIVLGGGKKVRLKHGKRANNYEKSITVLPLDGSGRARAKPKRAKLTKER